MALAALPCGVAFWPLLLMSGALPAVCGPETQQTNTTLEPLLAIGVMLPVVAILLGGVAILRIKHSRVRLKGGWPAQLGVTLGLLSLLMLIALPRFLIFQERGVQERAIRTVQRAERQYRALYPEAGYSPDLRSLGPPPPDVPRSAQHAGLVNPDLQEGLYCHGKEPLSYTPRAALDGKIEGYTIRTESHGVTKTSDETGVTSVTISLPR